MVKTDSETELALTQLIQKWLDLRDAYTEIQEVEPTKSREYDRVAYTFEFCIDGLRGALGWKADRLKF